MKSPTFLFALALAGALAPTHRARGETLFFTNFNFHPTDGLAGFGGVNERYATEFFTLGTSETVRGTALLMSNADTGEHDFEAWLYAADGPGNRPGTLLTAFAGAEDVLGAGQTGLATFPHAGFVLSPNTQYWIVTGIAEPVVQDSVKWHLTLSNNADGFGMFTVSTTPTTVFNYSSNGGASFTSVGPAFNGQFGLSDTAPSSMRTWDSGGTSDDWSDGGNWSSNHAPVNGDSVTFGSGARTNTFANFASLTVNDVTFTPSASVFTIHVPESASARQLTITGVLTNFSAF